MCVEPRFVGPDDAPDRYEMLERRAAGGEGEVWQATERHGTGSFRYAVKMIRLDGSADTAGALEGLRLQAALATHLEHPALVKVREVFVGAPPHPAGGAATRPGRQLYFVMKWIAGHSLQEALTRGDVRGLDVLAPLEPIAEAVDHLHGGRDTDGVPVIHRDIKPANILLATDGRVYLVDFGLVRLRSTDRTSRIFGTAPFMAPESLARGEYTPATDRYALGATLHYALTGEAPVPGDPQGTATRLEAALGPGRDREIRGIQAMLAVNPDARPASAAGWVRALRSAPPETNVGRPVPGPTWAGPATTGPSPFGPRGPATAGPGGPPSFGPGGPATTGPAPFGPGGPATVTPGGPPSFGPGGAGPATLGPAVGGGPPPPPLLPPDVSGYLAAGGGARPAAAKKSGAKTPLVVLGVILAVFVTCCGGLAAFSRSLEQQGYDAGASATPSRSFDRSRTPPPVTSLQPVLVSVADITRSLGVPGEEVETTESADVLYGGLSRLTLCAEGTLAGEAIGGATSNTYYVATYSYAYIGSSVAGFYADEARGYFAAIRRVAERCGWRQLQLGQLGEETYGAYVTGTGTSSKTQVALVFVRVGQVVMQVGVQTGGRGGYQTEAIRLATAMAKRLRGGR